jgi:hypothetical protein
MQSLIKNESWEIVDRPKDENAIKPKWIFRVKSCGRRKSRLVACDYSQLKHEDFQDTFAGVLNKSSFRYLIAYAAKHKMVMKSYDIETAFLNARLSASEISQLELEKTKCCLSDVAYMG